MWFIRTMASNQDGSKTIPIICPTSCLSLHNYNLIYPTVFFAWFANCKKYTILSDIPTISPEGDGDEMLGKIFGIQNLNDLQEKEETQDRITTA